MWLAPDSRWRPKSVMHVVPVSWRESARRPRARGLPGAGEGALSPAGAPGPVGHSVLPLTPPFSPEQSLFPFRAYFPS